MGKVTYSLRLGADEYDSVIRSASDKGQTIREWIYRAIRAQIDKQAKESKKC